MSENVAVPLSGGDHEVRIVGIVAQHVARRRDLAGDEVVGDVEQAAQEVAVALLPFGEERLALRCGGALFSTKPPLEPGRHDDGVLHDLRLHQPQHLRAEVLRAVRPAQPAARDLAAAQVDRLEARRIDPHLEEGPRLGQLRHFRRRQLERHVGLALALRVAHPVVGAQRGEDEVQQRRRMRSSSALGTAASCALTSSASSFASASRSPGRRRLEARVEKRGELARDGRMRGERLLDVGLAEREAACFRYFAYARRTSTSSAGSAANGVSWLKPSFSISRRATASSAASVTALIAPRRDR
jgi:hypothetical protein